MVDSTPRLPMTGADDATTAALKQELGRLGML
jgi:hypothetical protein